jgi:hypothetical protein
MAIHEIKNGTITALLVPNLGTPHPRLQCVLNDSQHHCTFDHLQSMVSFSIEGVN